MLSSNDQASDKIPVEIYNKIYCTLNDDIRLPNISTESPLDVYNDRRIGDDIKNDVMNWICTKSMVQLLSRNYRDIVMQNRYEVIILQDSTKIGWDSLIKQLEQVDSYEHQYGRQVKELVLDIVDPDIHLINAIGNISSVVPSLQNASVDIPLFDSSDLYDKFIRSFMKDPFTSIVNLNWSVGNPDEHGVLFSKLQSMTTLKSLKLFARETQYTLTNADQNTIFPHLQFVEFQFLRQNCTAAAEILAAWQLPSFTGLSLRGRPTGMGIMPIFIMHGSKLKFLELLVNVPLLQEILQLATVLQDFIYDVYICQEIIMSHDSICRVGIRGTERMDLHGNEIMRILEETMYSLTNRTSFPLLCSIRFMDWNILRLQAVMWSRIALIFWSKWIAITRERHIRLEDADGSIIPEYILYDN